MRTVGILMLGGSPFINEVIKLAKKELKKSEFNVIYFVFQSCLFEVTRSKSRKDLVKEFAKQLGQGKKKFSQAGALVEELGWAWLNTFDAIKRGVIDQDTALELKTNSIKMHRCFEKLDFLKNCEITVIPL